MDSSKDNSLEIRDYSSFCPKKYYEEYYSKIGKENAFLLNFFHEAYKNISADSRVLEFGGGPTIYQILSATRKVKEVVFAEYLDTNRKEINSWLEGNSSALNWTPYMNYVLNLNSIEINESNIVKFREQVSSKVTEIIECDAYLPNVLGTRSDNKFDVVSSNFCLECINGDQATFIEFIEKISGMVEKKGQLILTLLKNANSYQISGQNFPAYPVTEEFITTLLKSMNFSKIDLKFHEAEHSQGYDGLIALTARKL